MANDYAQHALSQRASFEATHPAVLTAAEQFVNEPVLRVADLGAADGVNSHGLIRDLAALRDGAMALRARMRSEGAIRAAEIMTLFERLHKAGNTIVLVTHEADVAAFAYRTIHIRDGAVEDDVRRAA